MSRCHLDWVLKVDQEFFRQRRGGAFMAGQMASSKGLEEPGVLRKPGCLCVMAAGDGAEKKEGTWVWVTFCGIRQQGTKIYFLCQRVV